MSVQLWRKKKHRSGKKRKPKKDRTRSFQANLERLEDAEIAAAILASQPLELTQESADAGGTGVNPEVVDTALFERQGEARSDAIMARRAINHRWETPKPLSSRLLEKALTLAVGDEWVKPNGEIRQEEWTPPQLIGAAKLALDVERQNQGQEHHDDRMGYYERALQMRAKVGDYTPPPGAGLKVETEGKATVTVYLPNNGRADPDDILRPEDLLNDDG